MSDITSYLDAITTLMRPHAGDRKYVTYEHLVRDLGHECEPGGLVEPLPAGPMGECFSNAVHAVEMACVLHQERPIYWEGYAISNTTIPLPLQHAWLTRPDDPFLVVDPTWDRGVAYFGVPIDWLYVVETMMRTKRYGVLGNDFMVGCTALLNGVPLDERVPRLD